MVKLLETIELSASAALRGRTVLVAEAASEARWAVVGALRDAGARVAEARDGQDALNLARGAPPDLVVASLAMPRMDGLALCAAIRREPSLRGVTVVLRADGEAPQALWEPNPSSRPLVEALLAALSHSRSGQRLKATAAQSEAEEWTAGEAGADSMRAIDVAERENVRAQSAVAMHREPANRGPRPPLPAVWRLGGGGGVHAEAGLSGFGWELQMMSRVFGLGFIALVAGVIALITWRVLSSGEASFSAGDIEPLSVAPVVIEVPSASTPRQASERGGLHAFSGTLRPGIDPALNVAPGDGVLELDGVPGLRIVVDGVDRGVLPISLVLPEGRHQVRYELDDESTVRFYYVEAGATRALRVITRPGGFVDAR
jgi:CheY-like chemotaxis protein